MYTCRYQTYAVGYQIVSQRLEGEISRLKCVDTLDFLSTEVYSD